MIKVTLAFPTIYAAAAALMTLQEAGHGNAVQADDRQAPVAGNVKPTFDPNSDKTQAIPRSVIEDAKKMAAAVVAQKDEASAQTASTEKPSASPAQAATAATTTTAETAAALDYKQDVFPLVIKVGAIGKRDALIELLKKFGVAKGPEVPAAKLPAFKADLESLLA